MWCSAPSEDSKVRQWARKLQKRVPLHRLLNSKGRGKKRLSQKPLHFLQRRTMVHLSIYIFGGNIFGAMQVLLNNHDSFSFLGFCFLIFEANRHFKDIEKKSLAQVRVPIKPLFQKVGGSIQSKKWEPFVEIEPLSCSPFQVSGMKNRSLALASVVARWLPWGRQEARSMNDG